MICIDRAQCRAWMTEHLPLSVRIDEGSGLPDLKELGLACAGFQLPPDSGSKVALARVLWNAVSADFTTVLVYIQNCHIWPSCGHLPLLHRFRLSYGESRDVDAAPGHVIDVSSDADSGTALLVLALEFFWDCLALTSGGNRAVYISHDEYYDFYSADPNELEEFGSGINKQK